MAMLHVMTMLHALSHGNASCNAPIAMLSAMAMLLMRCVGKLGGFLALGA